nr:hypothetical protein DM860_000423 [Ipomoea batatas]
MDKRDVAEYNWKARERTTTPKLHRIDNIFLCVRYWIIKSEALTLNTAKEEEDSRRLQRLSCPFYCVCVCVCSGTINEIIFLFLASITICSVSFFFHHSRAPSYAGVRCPKGDCKEGIRQRQGGYMVLQGHSLHFLRRIFTLPRIQHCCHVPEDLQKRFQMPTMAFFRREETNHQNARHEPEFKNHHCHDHVFVLVQEIRPKIPEEKQRRLIFRREGQGNGDAERLPHHIYIPGLRSKPPVGGEKEDGERRDEIRDYKAGKQYDVAYTMKERKGREKIGRIYTLSR